MLLYKLQTKGTMNKNLKKKKKKKKKKSLQ